MEYAIETLNIELFSLLKDYRWLKSRFVKSPEEEIEKKMANLIINIDRLQLAINKLDRVELDE